MTTLSLETMDNTRHWVSSLMILCQAFNAVVCGAICLLFCLQQVNACSIGFRSGDQLGHYRTFLFFAFELCTVKHSWAQNGVWSIWLSLRSYLSNNIFKVIFVASVTRSPVFGTILVGTNHCILGTPQQQLFWRSLFGPCDSRSDPCTCPFFLLPVHQLWELTYCLIFPTPWQVPL